MSFLEKISPVQRIASNVPHEWRSRELDRWARVLA